MFYSITMHFVRFFFGTFANTSYLWGTIDKKNANDFFSIINTII